MLHFDFLELVMIINKVGGVAQQCLLFMDLGEYLCISLILAVIGFETLYILLKEQADHIC
jgi:hypothetical protein